jgi:hypothetical protein
MRGNTLFCVALLVQAWSACALCACTDAGTSTGNPGPIDGGPPREVDNNGDGDFAGSGYCNAGPKTALALDEDSPLGFSPNDILAFASGTHEDTIRWNAQAMVEYGPESGEGAITITITPKGTARHVEPAPPGSGGTDIGGAAPAIDIDSNCTSWIEIDVEVSVETEGGALDETFEAVLRAHTPITTSLYASFKADALEGSFEAEGTGGLAGFVLGGTQIGVRFSTFGVSGSFHGWLTTSDTDGDSSERPAVGGGAPFATIGAAACIGEGFAVGASDDVEGVTVQDALDMLSESAQIDITWEDNTTTSSSFAFAATTPGGCVLLDNETPGDLTIVLDGTLSMASEDERLDGAFEGRFEAHIDTGAISRITFHVSDKRMSNVALGGEYYGFPDVDLSTYDAAGTALDVTVTSAGIEGTITLIAYTFAECERPTPEEREPGEDPGIDPGEGSGMGMSTPGCEGATPTELATGVLQ